MTIMRGERIPCCGTIPAAHYRFPKNDEINDLGPPGESQDAFLERNK